MADVQKEKEAQREAQKQKMKSMLQIVSKMRIKHVRTLLQLVRQPDVTCDHFCTQFGMTVGEFVSCYIITRQRSSLLQF